MGPMPQSKKKSSAKKTMTLDRMVPWLLVVGGFIGLICSFIISLDKLKLIQNPNFRPNCDLNPVVSCLSVMSSWQGSAFGFPNPWIGLVSFGALVTVGMAIFAGAKFKRWFWIGIELGCALGLIFAYWLLYESVYRIHALCPYCLTVDVVVITQFWYVTLYNVREGHIRLPKSWTRAANFARRHHFDILVVWFLITIILILKHFWYYYGKYL